MWTLVLNCQLCTSNVMLLQQHKLLKYISIPTDCCIFWPANGCRSKYAFLMLFCSFAHFAILVDFAANKEKQGPDLGMSIKVLKLKQKWKQEQKHKHNNKHESKLSIQIDNCKTVCIKIKQKLAIRGKPTKN